MADSPERGTAGTSAPAGTAGADKVKDGGAETVSLQDVLKKVDGLASLVGRFSNEVGQLRRGAQPGTTPRQNPSLAPYSLVPEEDDDPVQAELRATRQELEESRQERGIDRFLRLSGVTPDDMAQITSRLAENEERYHRYSRGPRGEARLDYYGSYNDVWRDIQIERLAKVKEAQAQQQTAQDRERREAAQRAGISGVGAPGTETGEVLDIASMSSAEYAEKVLKPAGLIDQNDPPSLKPYSG